MEDEDAERQQDYVLRTVEERRVKLVRLWFTDVLGSLKSFAISPAEIENALEGGMTFDGSSIDGFSRVQESDVLAIPDPNTFALGKLYTTRFYRLLKTRLAPDAAVSVQSTSPLFARAACRAPWCCSAW